MKKMKSLFKGSLIVALGISSVFLAETREVLPQNVSYAASEDEADLAAAKSSLEAKKSILEEKLDFAKKFMKTRAYKEASKTNKDTFTKEVDQIEDGLAKASLTLAKASSREEIKKTEEEISPAINSLFTVLNDIYSEDSLLSELVKANLVIPTNEEKYIPNKYLTEYKNASKKITEEYQEIWLENKVYKEDEVKGIIDNYHAVVKKINDANRGVDPNVKKIKELLERTQNKVDGIKYLKKVAPNSVKRYEDVIEEALAKAEKAIANAQAWLKVHDK